jgi:hypothetical protein
MTIVAAVIAMWMLGLLHLAFTLPAEFFRQGEASKAARESEGEVRLRA